MPEVCVRYATDAQTPMYTTVRMRLAEMLISRLPAMVVAALQGVMDIMDTQMTIDIQPYHAQAYNVASLAVEMRVNSEAYHDRQVVRDRLVASIVAWLQEPDQSGYVSANRLPNGIDVSIVFADSCGANVAHDGRPRSEW